MLCKHTHLKQEPEVWFCGNESLNLVHWFWDWVVAEKRTVGKLLGGWKVAEEIDLGGWNKRELGYT